MSSRVWVLATGVVFVIVAGALWWLSSDRSACLDRVAPPPDGAFARAVSADDDAVEIT